MSVSRCILILAIAITSMATPSVRAAQFLINPGDDWQAKAAKLRPGDEIVLMPGRHRPATIDRLVGTAQAPITIRGASTQKPSVINAPLDGIRIKEGAHVVIKDLQIIGGSASGIWIAAEQPDSNAQEPAPSTEAPAIIIPGEATPALITRTSRARDIYIENVSISRVGPRGQRHGVFLCGFADVRINRLNIEGWGGSAIELVACEDVTITKCSFKGIKDHSQYCGIRARAGCDRVSITEARFDNAGDIAVSIGARSNPEEYIPPIPPDAPNASVFEAARISLDQCTIIGSVCPVAFIHATDCIVRNTTIVRPRRCVFALLHQSPDVRVKPTGRNIFGNNLIVWQARDIARLVEVDQGVVAGDFVVEPNLWWSDLTAEQRGKLGPLPGSQPTEQVYDVDPRLNPAFKPTTPKAKTFGSTL